MGDFKVVENVGLCLDLSYNHVDSVQVSVSAGHLAPQASYIGVGDGITHEKCYQQPREVKQHATDPRQLLLRYVGEECRESLPRGCRLGLNLVNKYSALASSMILHGVVSSNIAVAT